MLKGVYKGTTGFQQAHVHDHLAIKNSTHSIIFSLIMSESLHSESLQGSTSPFLDQSSSKELEGVLNTAQSAEFSEMSRRSSYTQNMTDTTSSVNSFALSDGETILPPKQDGTFPTYREYTDSYLPRLRKRQMTNNICSQHAIAPDPINSTLNMEDDNITIFSDPERYAIMERSLDSYKSLETLVVRSEVIRNTMYVFSNSSSHECFEHRDQTINTSRSKLKSGRENIHTRPLMKIVVPYLSEFRPKAPYMIFRKFSESTQFALNPKTAEYDFCTVHLKNFYYFRRYTFFFQPPEGPSFEVLAFQNNFTPHTDFTYRDTRFRVLGTSRSVSYPTNYNPELKLFILDNDQPSFAEGLVEKKCESIFSKRKKKGDESPGGPRLENPIPSPEHPIIKLIVEDEFSSFFRDYVPQDLPPFGKFVDSSAYSKGKGLFMKRHSEVGKVGLYQASPESNPFGSTFHLSGNIDSLVLTTIFLALRETGIRTTLRHEDIKGLRSVSHLI